MRRIDLEARYEQDAQDCMAIRDTLDLIHNSDYPRRSDAGEYARMAEDLVDKIDEAFRSKLEPCHGCGDMDSKVTFSVDLDWRIYCPGCGRSVREETWSKAQDVWNAEEGEE